MFAVRKYELDPYLVTELSLPVGAKLLHVAEQNGRLCLWALVNMESSTAEETWHLLPATMGGPLETTVSRDAEYVGTVLLLSGSYVVHVFAVLAT